MQRVFIVETGDWEQRGVEAVFRTEAEADAYARAHHGSVECFEIAILTDNESPFLRPGERFYETGIDADGANGQAYPTWNKTDDDKLAVRIGKDGEPQRFSWGCWASSEEEALKMMRERRKEWMAGPRKVGSHNIQASSGSDYGWRSAT